MRYVTIEFKKIAGRTVAYPVCSNAQLFCEYNIQKLKSITTNQLTVIKRLGYIIKVKNDDGTYSEI